MTSLTAKILKRLRFEDEKLGSYEFFCAFLRVAVVLMAWTSHADLLSFHQIQSALQLVIGAGFLLVSLFALIGLGGPAATLACAALLVADRQILGVHDLRPELLYQHTTALATILFIVSFMPSFRHLSLFPGRGLPLWTRSQAFFLLRLLTIVIYAFAAFHKLGAFLTGQPMFMAIFAMTYTGSAGLVGPDRIPFFEALTLVQAFVEAAIVIGLLWPKTRFTTVIFAMVFHLALYPVLPVHVFSVLMIVLLLTFLEPERLDGLIARIRGPEAASIRRP